MYDRHRESNPHFLPRRADDGPVIDFQFQPTPPPQQRPHRPSHTSVQPSYGSRPQPPLQVGSPVPQPRHESPTHVIPQPPHHDQSKPHFAPDPAAASQPPPPCSPGTPAHHSTQYVDGVHHRRHRHPNNLRLPANRRTRPLAWLVAAFCALFWLIIIIGGLIILIVYLVFRPRNPRFDISTATLNAAYLDMGYLLNADVTLLINFTNPNTKVNVDFTYVVLDIYYEKRFIATRYVNPFSVMRRESRFADVHMVASQVGLSMGHSLQLQRQIAAGRVNFEIRGLFKTRSRFGGFFQYTYWLYAHCQIVVAGPPTGVLIGKRCVTKR